MAVTHTRSQRGVAQLQRSDHAPPVCSDNFEAMAPGSASAPWSTMPTPTNVTVRIVRLIAMTVVAMPHRCCQQRRAPASTDWPPATYPYKSQQHGHRHLVLNRQAEKGDAARRRKGKRSTNGSRPPRVNHSDCEAASHAQGVRRACKLHFRGAEVRRVGAALPVATTRRWPTSTGSSASSAPLSSLPFLLRKLMGRQGTRRKRCCKPHQFVSRHRAKSAGQVRGAGHDRVERRQSAPLPLHVNSLVQRPSPAVSWLPREALAGRPRCRHGGDSRPRGRTHSSSQCGL